MRHFSSLAKTIRDKRFKHVDDEQAATSVARIVVSMDNEPNSALPTPPSRFISYLSEHLDALTRDLLQPYISYETQLRKDFMRADAEIDALANLVPIYDDRESQLTIRTIDRQASDSEKYLMPLKDDEQEREGRLAIASSIELYQNNFEGFTRGR